MIVVAVLVTAFVAFVFGGVVGYALRDASIGRDYQQARYKEGDRCTNCGGVLTAEIRHIELSKGQCRVVSR